MPSHPLSPDDALGIKIRTVVSRNQFATDPDVIAAVVDQLYETASGRLDLLAEEVGLWVGFYEADPWTTTLAARLRELPLLMDEAITLGRRRRAAPMLERRASPTGEHGRTCS
ncbi:hypothetical protein RL72_01819 [Microbacterium azadirachtae]|uniref:Uncharacterized protein n=1 Tax=Microbacterium azadirachtae TaxID=582680 RepID=A0A0F0KTY8_9MICO|nr:hypothetical protein [Microbacterium azadirachtae]KJL24328.1 hypothetical protein RL72_01819 [Microbacterium azadirachtae]